VTTAARYLEHVELREHIVAEDDLGRMTKQTRDGSKVDRRIGSG